MKFITATPTIASGAYASGDMVGTLMTFDGGAGKTCIVQNASLFDLAAQSATLDLIFFKSSITVPADNAAYSVTDADLQQAFGSLQFDTYTAMGSGRSYAFKSNLGIAVPLDFSNDEKFYGLLIARGTPNYAGAGKLIVQLGVIEYTE